MTKGTQIVYRPTGEAGFVTTVENDMEVFCRFWQHPLADQHAAKIGFAGSLPRVWRLRTTTCGELVKMADVEVRNTVPQAWVDEILAFYCWDRPYMEEP